MEGPLAKFLRDDVSRRAHGAAAASTDRNVAVGADRRLAGTEQPSRLEPAATQPSQDESARPHSSGRGSEFQRELQQARKRIATDHARRYSPGDANRRGALSGRRRRLLGAAFAVALLVLLLVNATGLARPEGPLDLSAASLGEAVRGLAPGYGNVRVFRYGAPRTVANLIKGPVRVGVQVGHLAASEQPDELAALRYSTGANAHGVDEVEVNLAVATALTVRLAARGIEVDLLPATVPPAYRADLVLSIHADANEDLGRSGYKSAHFQPARNSREALLKVSVDRAMLLATGLRDDDRNVSGNMLHYYAFNQRHFRHAVARSTPALLVELGYLSNPNDLRVLQESDRLAAGLELGVLAYLSDIGRLEATW